LRSWSVLRREVFELERLVTLIVVASRDGWELHGYIVRAGAGRDVCQPLYVT
jgi:hypothetical protein